MQDTALMRASLAQGQLKFSTVELGPCHPSHLQALDAQPLRSLALLWVVTEQVGNYTELFLRVFSN